MNIDIMSTFDIQSRLDRNQARKLVFEIMTCKGLHAVSLTKHCREEATKDFLDTVDLFNVLRGCLKNSLSVTVTVPVTVTD